MAFDGSAVHAIMLELSHILTDGRILKIAQTEKEELILTIKKEGRQFRLLISVNPSLPVVYLTQKNKNAPLQAPAFCMLLRKHLTNGRILSVTQPSMERILEFTIEHFNEMGDICQKILTVELMGKYSNIILRQDNLILDSIRHVSAMMSSVREVLPGREYFVPFSEDKLDPFVVTRERFLEKVCAPGPANAAKALYTQITGFSPMLAQEVLYRAGLDADRPASSFTKEEQDQLYRAFAEVMSLIQESNQCHDHPGDNQGCNIIYKEEEPVGFATFVYQTYQDPRYSLRFYTGISELLYDFYAQKQTFGALRQKTAALRQVVHTLLNKDYKKYDLQLRQLKDTEKKEKYRVYGELLTAYGYSAEPGATSFQTVDFYTGQDITIPLDPQLTAVENGKNYFKRYAKLKRTADALNEIIVQTKDEIDHLESVMVSLDLVRNAADIAEIRKELSQSGYIKSQPDNRQKPGRSKKQANTKPEKNSPSSPLQYVSSDGFSMFVGKNNYQNEYLTFKLATGGDWWFHAKDIPGSHVIVKTDGADLPDRTYEEAARLAAHYSKSEGSSKVEVQYTQRKNLKKPPAAKPGFVVFSTYYSMAASTDISGIQEIN